MGYSSEKKYLVNSRTNEFAAKKNVTKKDVQIPHDSGYFDLGTSQEKGEPKPTENVQDTTLPQPTTTTSKVEEAIEEKKSVSPPSPDLKTQQKMDFQILSEPIKDQKVKEELVPKPTPPPRVATMQTYEKSQKVQEVVESKPTTTMLTKVKRA
ncbi:hypothetical protein JHK87_000653 [Glycine soja]|nr:hypothetical protein JHK87_000653 [Glycine soja]